MSSPIQGAISVAAAGAQPNLVAAAAGKGAQPASNLHNSGVQQLVATEATKGITKPFEKKTTSGEAALDASFNSNEGQSGGRFTEEEEKEEEEEILGAEVQTVIKKKKLLDIIA